MGPKTSGGSDGGGGGGGRLSFGAAIDGNLSNVICSVGRANNSWSSAEREGEVRDHLRSGYIRQTPQPRDDLWERGDTFDKQRYRTLSSTAARDSYIIDCTSAKPSLRDWRLRFDRATRQPAQPATTITGAPCKPASRFPLIPTKLRTGGLPPPSRYAAVETAPTHRRRRR